MEENANANVWIYPQSLAFSKAIPSGLSPWGSWSKWARPSLHLDLEALASAWKGHRRLPPRSEIRAELEGWGGRHLAELEERAFQEATGLGQHTRLRELPARGMGVWQQYNTSVGKKWHQILKVRSAMLQGAKFMGKYLPRSTNESQSLNTSLYILLKIPRLYFSFYHAHLSLVNINKVSRC